MTSFVESKDFYFIMCNNTEGDKMNDHIEGVFNEMLSDVRFIKLKTYFKFLEK